MDPFDQTPEDELAPATPDQKTLEAAADLRDHIVARPTQVFYERELQVQFEKKWFHWISGRALRYLSATDQLGSEVYPTPRTKLRFFFSKRLRYLRRPMAAKAELVDQIAGLGRALGAQGELLAENLLLQASLDVVSTNGASWRGRSWTRTAHDLDFICAHAASGHGFGVEVKNTLGYIPRDELKIKLDLCDELQIHPVFILRWAPKSYIHEVADRGGWVILFEHQHYPFGHEVLIDSIRRQLAYPVIAARTMQPGALHRLRIGVNKLSGTP